MKILSWLMVLGILLGVALPAQAATFPDKPAGQDFFVDQAKLIAEKDRATINETAKKLLAEKQIPIFVVTIESLAKNGAIGMGIENYATELFNKWGIGSQERNYGILLLVSSGDRKARIELGAGFKHDYDAASLDVMDSLIVPAFKRGEFSTGIADGVKGLDAMARGLQLPSPTTPAWFWPVVIGFALFAAFGIRNLFKAGMNGWAWALIAGLGALVAYMLFRGGRGGDSSGGFGGGSSGGGGASGSW